jgi:hypothetical protein
MKRSSPVSQTWADGRLMPFKPFTGNTYRAVTVGMVSCIPLCALPKRTVHTHLPVTIVDRRLSVLLRGKEKALLITSSSAAVILGLAIHVRLRQGGGASMYRDHLSKVGWPIRAGWYGQGIVPCDLPGQRLSGCAGRGGSSPSNRYGTALQDW